MPYIFVGFDICHQLHSPPLPGLASSETMWEAHIKKPCHPAMFCKMARGFMDVANRWLF